jgi:mannose-6-phosphate isomerase-like protein (cupin superfamily)
MERKQFLITGLMACAAVGTSTASSLKKITTRKPLKPFYIPPDKPLVANEGVELRVKVRSGQTDMQYTCVDFSIAARTMGPPPHVHTDLDELMYVHEGIVNVMVGDEVYEVKAGGWHFRPHGIIHTFWNASDKPAYATDMYFNQNFEEYLEEIYFKIRPEMKAKDLSPADPKIAKRFAALDQKFGVTHFHERRPAIMEKYGLKG